MKPIVCFLAYFRRICSAFYSFLLKLNIDAHQYIAYWKSRIRLQQQDSHITREINNRANVELSSQSAQFQTGPSTGPSIDGSKLTHHSSVSHQTVISNQVVVQESDSQFVSSKPIKTPRNPLNEASSSGSSNRFDLTAYNSSIWVLGRRYDLPEDNDALIEDIKSKLWITYRKNFPPIDENTRYTTDRGFGCMIRCGQMVLANALLYKNLGRDWRWSPRGLNFNPPIYFQILKLFQDRQDCPYSLHKIVQTGQNEGKTVGEWFGPNTIAQALKRMSINYLADNLVDSNFAISIDAALDNMVVIEEIKRKFKRVTVDQDGPTNYELIGQTRGLADQTSTDHTNSVSETTSGDDRKWTPGILFIQLRLGLTKINPIYFDALRKTFQFKNSLGIIGGRPNHALYLVGYTNDEIIYLDPHNTQQYIDFDNLATTPSMANDQQSTLEESTGDSSTGKTEQSAESSIESPDGTYHCSYPEKMPLDRLDPSLALCFYFSTEEEFDSWCDLSQDLLVKSEQAPMFEITKLRPTDWNISITSRTISKSSSDHDGEEFEILT